MTTELVIFDCDGVLIDSEAISAKMLVEEMAERGITIDTAYVTRNFLGRSYPVVLSTIRAEFGVDLPEDFEASYRARLLAAFERDLRVMPGVTDVLQALNLPFCLATSSSAPRVKRSLEIVGLTELFKDRVTTASEVPRGKPAPDLFLLAARKMGVDPARALVIEDSLNGIRAGRAAGAEVWHFTGGSHLCGVDLGPEFGSEAHRRFASFADFFQIRPDLMNSEAPA
ncbi:HAD family hydrolase [Halovulum sp. GXIMD14794]